MVNVTSSDFVTVQTEPLHLQSVKSTSRPTHCLYWHLLVACTAGKRSALGASMAETARILVTGGGGFIGSSLVKELASRGHQVLASDLDNRDQEGYVRCDVRAFRQLERLVDSRRLDFLFPLAAEDGRWQRQNYS